MGFYSSSGELNLINKLRPVALNFGKSIIVKGSCIVAPDSRLLLLDDAITDSVRFLLAEGTSAVGIAVRLSRKIFLAILLPDSSVALT